MVAKQEKFDTTLLVASLVAGAMAWAIDMVIYHALIDVWSRPVLIGVMFLVLAVVVSAAVLAASKAKRGFDEEFLFLQSTGAIVLGLAVTAVAVFAVALVLEWIYDRQFAEMPEPTSYIFLLDESSSMEDNDPEKLRYAAVDQVMSGLQTAAPYAAYCFADTTVLCRAMGPYAAGEEVPWQALGGGTMLRGGLERILSDLESGTLAGGEAPLVVMLSDGYFGDIGGLRSADDLLKRFASAGIRISTVGLGSYDRSVLERVANRTGGVHLAVEEAPELAAAMKTAVSGQASRDLLSVRPMTANEPLYGILRVLFLTLLGGMMAFARAMACARMNAHGLILIVGAVAALLGALLLELGLAVLPMWLCWLLLWLLISATPALLTVGGAQISAGYVTGYTSFGGDSSRKAPSSGGIRFR